MVYIPKIDTQVGFRRFLLYKHNVGDRSGIQNFVYDPFIQKFSKILLYEGFKQHMYFSQLMLIWLDPFLDWNDMLDDPCVISFQVIVRPHKHILVLFEQANKGFSFLLCATCPKIDKPQIMFYSQDSHFVPHG